MPPDTDRVVDAVLRISWAYLPERIVYMVGAGSGVLLLLYLAFVELSGAYDPAVAAAIFGSGGLFAVTAYGVLRAFDKTLDTVRVLLSAQLRAGHERDTEG